MMTWFLTLWFVSGLWAGVFIWKQDEWWASVMESSEKEYTIEGESEDDRNIALLLAKILLLLVSFFLGFISVYKVFTEFKGDSN